MIRCSWLTMSALSFLALGVASNAVAESPKEIPISGCNFQMLARGIPPEGFAS